MEAVKVHADPALQGLGKQAERRLIYALAFLLLSFWSVF